MKRMKKALFAIMCTASLVMMTACSGGGSAKKEASGESVEVMEGVTKLQRKTLEEIGKTTSDKVVLESKVTTFEDERYMVYDFSDCGPDGTNTYLNYLLFPDKESYDEWQTEEKPKLLQSDSYDMVSEDRNGLLVVYRQTLGYKRTYEQVQESSGAKVVK